MSRRAWLCLIAVSLCLLVNLNGVVTRSTAASTTCSQLLFSGTTSTPDFDMAHFIYRINPDGSGITQLTQGIVFDTYPLWSPDGKYIAFIRANLSDPNDNKAHLYVMAPDGSAVRRLTDDTMTGEFYPVWSRDSSILAFVGAQNEQVAVFTIHPDGKALNRLLALDKSASWFPGISNDDIYGTRFLSFSADGQSIHVWYGGNSGLQTIDLGGKITSTIAFSGLDPEWAPDDSQIVYIDGKGGSTDVFVMAADGSRIRRLTKTGEEQYPAWSPDGLHIALSSNRYGNSDAISNDIYVMSPDGSNVKRLTFDMKDYWLPTWSPDGKHLVFWSNLTGQSYIIDADGQNFHMLTDLNANDHVTKPGSPDISRAVRFSWSPSLC